MVEEKRRRESGETPVLLLREFHWYLGEHRLRPGEMTAFDTDIHVPLVATGPGVPAGHVVNEIVENIDLCPTFTELANAIPPANVDGRSLVPLFQGREVSDWRTAALIEHHGPLTNRADPDAPGRRSGNPPNYEAIRMLTSVYIEYATGEREYHDLATDPHELHDTFHSLSEAKKKLLRALLYSIKNCHDEKTCRAAERVILKPMQNR